MIQICILNTHEPHINLLSAGGVKRKKFGRVWMHMHQKYGRIHVNAFSIHVHTRAQPTFLPHARSWRRQMAEDAWASQPSWICRQAWCIILPLTPYTKVSIRRIEEYCVCVCSCVYAYMYDYIQYVYQLYVSICLSRFLSLLLLSI